MGERDATIRERDGRATAWPCSTPACHRPDCEPRRQRPCSGTLVFVECYRDVMAQREAEYPALLAKIREALS